MKIPKSTAPEPPAFKRKRGPPPQATKLLVASLGAGLVFMALLAIVFVPRYLENLNPPPSTVLILQANTTVGPRIVVISTTLNLNLSLFNATLVQNDTVVASLPAGLGGGGTVLGFTDANHDGVLDTGDYFTVNASSLSNAVAGRFSLQVYQVNVGYRVGVASWTGLLRTP
ncbi:MAG TPA: hypothetical protein VEY12_04410 [Thermoplasmata archaeon]|nr:hypothetical protein [Thermoplasmata archaeon]